MTAPPFIRRIRLAQPLHKRNASHARSASRRHLPRPPNLTLSPNLSRPPNLSLPRTCPCPDSYAKASKRRSGCLPCRHPLPYGFVRLFCSLLEEALLGGNFGERCARRYPVGDGRCGELSHLVTRLGELQRSLRNLNRIGFLPGLADGIGARELAVAIIVAAGEFGETGLVDVLIELERTA